MNHIWIIESKLLYYPEGGWNPMPKLSFNTRKRARQEANMMFHTNQYNRAHFNNTEWYPRPSVKYRAQKYVPA